MIIVQGYMRVAPAKFTEFSQRFAAHSATVAAYDGCLQYSISEDPGEPGLLWIGERWRDKAAQSSHLASDHMAIFNNLMKHLDLKSAEITAFECTGERQWLMRTTGK